MVVEFSRWLYVFVGGCGSFLYAPSKLNIKPVQRLFKIAEYAFMLSGRSAFKFCGVTRRDYIISFQSS